MNLENEQVEYKVGEATIRITGQQEKKYSGWQNETQTDSCVGSLGAGCHIVHHHLDTAAHEKFSEKIAYDDKLLIRASC